MDENGLLCDDIDVTIAMCNALSDNGDVRCICGYVTIVMRRFQSDIGNVIITM